MFFGEGDSVMLDKKSSYTKRHEKYNLKTAFTTNIVTCVLLVLYNKNKDETYIAHLNERISAESYDKIFDNPFKESKLFTLKLAYLDKSKIDPLAFRKTQNIILKIANSLNKHSKKDLDITVEINKITPTDKKDIANFIIDISTQRISAYKACFVEKAYKPVIRKNDVDDALEALRSYDPEFQRRQPIMVFDKEHKNPIEIKYPLSDGFKKLLIDKFKLHLDKKDVDALEGGFVKIIRLQDKAFFDDLEEQEYYNDHKEIINNKAKILANHLMKHSYLIDNAEPSAAANPNALFPLPDKGKEESTEHSGSSSLAVSTKTL